MNMQDERIDDAWLRNRGYSVASAARKIGRSTTQVFRVVKGERVSASVIRDLMKLPRRPYIARERIAAPKSKASMR